MWCGVYEPHVSLLLSAILRAGDVFIDVGAHVGYHSFFAARHVGASGRIFSFEPDPDVYGRLVRNLACFSHARCERAAVWETDGERTFERSSRAEESGWGTLTDVRDTGYGEKIVIKTVRLDAYCERAGIGNIRAIKIDAEGSEPAVLRGAEGVLRRFRPILLMEFNGTLLEEAGSSSQAVTRFLRELNYELSCYGPGRRLRFAAPTGLEFMDCMAIPHESCDEVFNTLREHGMNVEMPAGRAASA